VVNPLTRTIDHLGTRNRNLNVEVVGVAAATYAARCVVWLLLLSLVATAWVIVYVLAVAAKAFDLARVSVLAADRMALVSVQPRRGPTGSRPIEGRARIPTEVVDVLFGSSRLDRSDQPPEALARARQMAASPLVGSSDRTRGA
jgi:hypothetical protein